jgi:hypothetical protein
MKKTIKSGMAKEYQYTLTTRISDISDPSGEEVKLEVDVYDNGDKTNNIFTNAHITAQSYGTSSIRLTLWGPGFGGLLEACKKIEKELYSKEEEPLD